MCGLLLLVSVFMDSGHSGFLVLVLSRARSAMRKNGVFAVHFRFLNSIIASFSAMYSKPASISAVASVMLAAVLHVHSSSFRFISCVYMSVVSILLCPICCLVYSMSLVLWYVIVAK